MRALAHDRRLEARVLANRSLCFVSFAWLCAGMLAACARPVPPPQQAPAPVAAPTGRLPGGVVPTAYNLELTIRPDQERFAGRAQIAVSLTAPAAFFWLHGKNLSVKQVLAQVGPKVVAGRYSEVDDSGLSRIDFAEVLPAGSHVITIDYDAAFNRQLSGLYKVQSGGQPYAFTQFEPVRARTAFPCFDEPRFKTPFDISLTVAGDHVAISNTPELASEVTPEGMRRVRFATSKPLPTYLVAFIVGPLDVVSATPIAPSELRLAPLPLRGVAVKGQGPALSYALEHTGPLLLWLERYFGVAYPYEKLDIIAVPDFSSGAMENAGAITFRDRLLFIDPKSAPESQLRAYANVMAHELAHHWTGNLVTMPWWDDIWLNEGFATFMATKTVAAVHPEQQALLAQQASVQWVMDGDSRQSARRVRQPIETTHDIANAFDGITYQKGAGVIGMFERWLGEEVFRAGIQAHLRAHPHGVATSAELMASLGTAASKDVATPFGTFLDQVGVPLISVEVRCSADGKQNDLALKQTRYLPIGSSAERTQQWRVPVCARYQVGGLTDELCTLLEGPEGVMPLDGGGCPLWVMPNADGAGYYRWSLPSADLENLRKAGYAKLTPREKLSLADSLTAGFESGALAPAAVLAQLPSLAADEDRSVATTPIGLLSWIREYALDEATRPALDRYARDLYAARLRKLGWKERPKDSGEQKLLRAEIIGFLAQTVRDPATRAQLQQLGKQYLGLGGKAKPEAVPNDLRSLAVQVAVQDGDDALFDSVRARFGESQDPIERERLLGALASVTDARSARALALTLDPALRGNELQVPLRYQSNDERTREAAFQYLEQNIEAIIQRLSPERSGGLPWLGAGFCSKAGADRVQALFAARIEKLQGGPRSLASVLEGLALCSAEVEQLRPQIQAFFSQPQRAPKAGPAALPSPPTAAPAAAKAASPDPATP
jgi:alanyl aminopeptidase